MESKHRIRDKEWDWSRRGGAGAKTDCEKSGNKVLDASEAVVPSGTTVASALTDLRRMIDPIGSPSGGVSPIRQKQSSLE